MKVTVKIKTNGQWTTYRVPEAPSPESVLTLIHSDLENKIFLRVPNTTYLVRCSDVEEVEVEKY